MITIFARAVKIWLLQRLLVMDTIGRNIYLTDLSYFLPLSNKQIDGFFKLLLAKYYWIFPCCFDVPKIAFPLTSMKAKL